MGSKKWSPSLPLIAFLCIGLLLHVISTNAQVTFSRDWNAGKRSIQGCQSSMRSAVALCQMLLNELKSMAPICEMRPGMVSKLPDLDSLPVLDLRTNG